MSLSCSLLVNQLYMLNSRRNCFQSMWASGLQGDAEVDGNDRTLGKVSLDFPGITPPPRGLQISGDGRNILPHCRGEGCSRYDNASIKGWVSTRKVLFTRNRIMQLNAYRWMYRIDQYSGIRVDKGSTTSHERIPKRDVRDFVTQRGRRVYRES